MSEQQAVDENQARIEYAHSPDAQPTPQAARAERNRRLKHTLITSLATKPLTQLSALLIPMWLVQNLGRTRYGVFEATISMAALLGFTNAGLTLGLLNRLTDCHVANDRVLARRYMSSLLITLAGIAGVVLVLWTVLSWAIPWAHVLKATAAVAPSEIKHAIFLAGLAALFGMVFNLPTVVYSAYQELAIANLWDAGTKVSAMLATFAVVHVRWGLVGAALATACVPTAISLTNMLWIFLRRPWLRPTFALFDYRLVWSTLGDGVLLSALQLSVALLFQADKFIIGAVVGAASVAPYALLARVFMTAYGIYYIVLSPLWPAYGEALRRGDVHWALRAMRFSQLLGGVIAVGTGAVMLTGGNWILKHWSHGEVAQVSRSLVLAVTCTFALRVWVDSRAQLLNSVGYLRPQVVFFLAHSFLNLIVAIFAARRFGPEGAAWATPITSLMTSAWGYPLLIRRYMTRHREALAVRE
jgi:O-antigen/teichoic acid export membrane protein